MSTNSEPLVSPAELQQLEQAAQMMDEDIQRLFLKHQKRESAFHKANKSLNDKAQAFIDNAKKESGLVIQDAKSQAEAILAGAIEETEKLKAEQNAFVEDAEQQAEAILAGATEETEKWEAEKTALAGVQRFGRKVKLDVGGVRTTTSLTTLCRFPDAMIGCMFSGRHPLPEGEDGYFFIDRDGTHFRHILNFLRSPEDYKVEVGGADARELRRECKYYGIDELMFPGTQKSLPYYDLRGHTKKGDITVLIDDAGVYTTTGVHYDSGNPIECCTHCRNAFFTIRGEKFCFKDLWYGNGHLHHTSFVHQSLPAAGQPELQGQCPSCRSCRRV
jgi:hypothetical protein